MHYASFANGHDDASLDPSSGKGCVLALASQKGWVNGPTHGRVNQHEVRARTLAQTRRLEPDDPSGRRSKRIYEPREWERPLAYEPKKEGHAELQTNHAWRSLRQLDLLLEYPVGRMIGRDAIDRPIGECRS
jgi:hypothetical protein